MDGLVGVWWGGTVQFSSGFLPERKEPQQLGALGGTALEGQFFPDPRELLVSVFRSKIESASGLQTSMFALG